MENEKPFFIEGDPLFESEQEKNQREIEETKDNERSEYEWALDVISGKKKRKTKKAKNKPKGEWGVRNSKLENLTKNATNQDAKNYLQWLSAKKHNPDLAKAMQIISEKALRDYKKQHQEGLQSLENYDPEQERKEIIKNRTEAMNSSDNLEQDSDDTDKNTPEPSLAPEPEVIEPSTISDNNFESPPPELEENDTAIATAKAKVLNAMDDIDDTTTNQPVKVDTLVNIEKTASTTVPKGTFESEKTPDDKGDDQNISEEIIEVKPAIVPEKKSTGTKEEPETISPVFAKTMQTKDVAEMIDYLNNEAGVEKGVNKELELKEGLEFDFGGKKYVVRKISPETNSVFVGIGEIEEHATDKKIPKEVKQIEFSTKKLQKMDTNELEEMLDYLKNEKGISGISEVEKGFGKRLSLKPGLKFYFEGREYNVGKIDYDKGIASVWIGEDRVITDVEPKKEPENNQGTEEQDTPKVSDTASMLVEPKTKDQEETTEVMNNEGGAIKTISNQISEQTLKELDSTAEPINHKTTSEEQEFIESVDAKITPDTDINPEAVIANLEELVRENRLNRFNIRNGIKEIKRNIWNAVADNNRVKFNELRVERNILVKKLTGFIQELFELTALIEERQLKDQKEQPLKPGEPTDPEKTSGNIAHEPATVPLGKIEPKKVKVSKSELQELMDAKGMNKENAQQLLADKHTLQPEKQSPNIRDSYINKRLVMIEKIENVPDKDNAYSILVRDIVEQMRENDPEDNFDKLRSSALEMISKINNETSRNRLTMELNKI